MEVAPDSEVTVVQVEVMSREKELGLWNQQSVWVSILHAFTFRAPASLL